MKITDEMLYEHAAKARDLWLSTMPSEDEVPEFKCSRRFERKMKKLLREQRRSARTNQILHFARTAVAVILIAATMTFSGLMTVEAYRAKVIEVVVQVFNDLTNYRFSSNYGEEGMELPDVTFGYIPEGMVEDSREDYDGVRYILYKNSSGQLFELSQKIILPEEDYQMILDTENADTEYFYINGEDAIANSKNGNNTVIWSRGNVRYKLYGNITIDELKAIAQHIK